MIDKENNQRIIEVYGYPIFDEKGNVSGVIIIMRDTTKETEDSMIRSDFAYASHQLRTPVTKAMLLLEAVWEESDVEKIKTGAKESYQALESVSKLSKELLNVSEIDTDMVIPRIETVKLTDLCDNIMKEVEKKATEHEVKIIAPSVSATTSINTSPNLLKRALVEILDNAIIYSPKKSEIKLNITKDESTLLFEIMDSGLGIDLEHQPLIFTKFFRGSNFETSEIPGAGLGLYIAREYIKLSKGKIWFKTEEKKGTTFYVSIPLTA